ncbi:hypothetical protein F2Q69_00049375 [Brassica cretica]|uniref:Uncharacterized protein n=1 Tax=Brassica cretica TaxID=69181 RepID=A0A8S9Q3F2_BRACR|nr:hypothetical protein F2Q69_00049375 [Brassica cretica]
MNRGNTPKPKQDAEPPPQLSLTPSLQWPLLLVLEKRVKPVSKPPAPTSKHPDTRSTKRNHLRNSKNRLHLNQAQHLPPHDSNASKLAFWPATPRKQRQSRTEPPEAERKTKRTRMDRSR